MQPVLSPIIKNLKQRTTKLKIFCFSSFCFLILIIHTCQSIKYLKVLFNHQIYSITIAFDFILLLRKAEIDLATDHRLIFTNIKKITTIHSFTFGLSNHFLLVSLFSITTPYMMLFFLLLFISNYFCCSLSLSGFNVFN